VLGALLSRLHWTFDLAGQFLLPALCILLAVFVLLIVLTLIQPDGAGHGVFIAVALLALAGGGLTLRTPPGPANPQSAQAISVYQHNIWVRNPDMDGLVRAMESADADIVALVEARPDRFAPFERRLAEHWPHQAWSDNSPMRYARLRLLSKHEIESWDVRRPRKSPALLRARLATPDGALTVIVVHMTRPWPFDTPNAQIRQFSGLLEWIKEEDGPLIVLGDFNSAAWGRLAQRIVHEQDFQLVNHRHVPTWPHLAMIPIDLAFCRDGAICSDHSVAGLHGSDHRAVSFNVRLAGSGTAQ